MNIKPITTDADWCMLVPHPFSELTEFGVGIDTEALIDHMARNGWDESERITLYQAQILDGRHKHSCAQKAEVEPLFQEFIGTDAEALEFVRKKLLRQHLDASQRAMIAAKLATLKDGCRRSSNDEGAATRAEAASQMNTSTASVDRAKLVLEKCIPAIQTAVHKGQLSVSDAAAGAKESVVRQEKALDAWRLGKVKTLAEWVKKNPKKPKAKKPPKQQLFDKTGRAVPDSCRDAFADPSLGQLIAEVSAALYSVDVEEFVDWATKLTDHYGFILLEKFGEHIYDAQEKLQLALETLKAGVPYAVCPACQGAKENCPTCRGHGYVPEHRYLELTREPA